MLLLNKIHLQPNSQTHTFRRKKREQKINPRVSFTPGLSISLKQKQREKVARLKKSSPASASRGSTRGAR